ncbi:MAG: helix-turn-helix transcriptional regulator [Acutalibacteraceae bacterium]|nr:helix-turn-helix transcriptional regulator [Acutalibacteraceae bacterium]
MHKEEFARILSENRKLNNLTQKELAEKTGFTVRAIQYWEKGTKNISLENADKLLKALGVEVEIGSLL